VQRDDVREAIFGISDGAATTVGAMFGLFASGHRNAILVATLSAGLSSTESMAAGEYLSDDDSSLRRALAMALGTAVGGLAPAIPFAIGHSVNALVGAVIITLALGLWVVQERAKVKGFKLALAQVYVTFVIVAGSTFALGEAL
jgi:VIT1/CCC1 family predicted Fe2+/Mn2+ transporter